LRQRSTTNKRNREKELVERQQEKVAKRNLRKLDRQNRAEAGVDGDPDIAGIKPGPQKLDPLLFGTDWVSDKPSGD